MCVCVYVFVSIFYSKFLKLSDYFWTHVITRPLGFTSTIRNFQPSEGEAVGVGVPLLLSRDEKEVPEKNTLELVTDKLSKMEKLELNHRNVKMTLKNVRREHDRNLGKWAVLPTKTR